MIENKKILLTGATGYIGGRLLTRLQERNLPVACLTRRPEALDHRKTNNTESPKIIHAPNPTLQRGYRFQRICLGR